MAPRSRRLGRAGPDVSDGASDDDRALPGKSRQRRGRRAAAGRGAGADAGAASSGDGGIEEEAEGAASSPKNGGNDAATDACESGFAGQADSRRRARGRQERRCTAEVVLEEIEKHVAEETGDDGANEHCNAGGGRRAGKQRGAAKEGGAKAKRYQEKEKQRGSVAGAGTQAAGHAAAEGRGSKGARVEELRVAALTCIALKSHHGKFVRADPAGPVRGTSSAAGDAEKFQVVHHDDGLISLRSHHGAFLSVERNGEVRATRTAITASEKLELVQHADGTVSLYSQSGFIAAESRGGVLRANRREAGAWERFQLKDRSSRPGQAGHGGDVGKVGFSTEAVRAPSSTCNGAPPLFDAFCELEQVLLAEEVYASTHSDRVATTYDKRARARRAQGLELSFKNFREEHSYPGRFGGCVSAWDVTAIMREERLGQGATACHARRRTRSGSGNSRSELESATVAGAESSWLPSWRRVIEEEAAVPEAPPVYAAFGIRSSAAAEANEAAFERLEELCKLPHCVALGPVGVDFQDVPDEAEANEGHRGLSASEFVEVFGASPSQQYDAMIDPQCLAWLASGPGLKPEAWMLKHGDRRMDAFKRARADYLRRRQAAQVAVAERQLRMARDLDIPLVIQLPPQDEAEKRMAEILVSCLGQGCSHPILLSSFRGRPKCAAALLLHLPGLVLGFSGLLTHSKLKDVLGETAFDVPLDRFVFESLGPRYPPATVPEGDARGGYSHPVHVAAVAPELAKVKRIAEEELLAAAWRNVKRTFRLFDCARPRVATERSADGTQSPRTPRSHDAGAEVGGGAQAADDGRRPIPATPSAIVAQEAAASEPASIANGR